MAPAPSDARPNWFAPEAPASSAAKTFATARPRMRRGVPPRPSTRVPPSFLARPTNWAAKKAAGAVVATMAELGSEGAVATAEARAWPPSSYESGAKTRPRAAL